MYWMQNAKILLWCDVEHVRILSLLLFYFNNIGVHCYHEVNIFLMETPLHTGVNLVYSKGAHREPYEIYMMQLTRWIWDCFLEESAHVMQIMLSGDIISCVYNIIEIKNFHQISNENIL